MRSYLQAAGGSVLLLALNACSPISGNMQAVAFGKSESTTPPTDAKANLSCLDNKVDYVLNTEVLDFEMQGGGGLNAGFSPNGMAALTSINVGVNYSQGQLQTMMHLTDPLKPGVPLVNVPGQATNKNITFSMDLSAAIAKLGPSVWYSTPIAQLSQDALTSNLTALNTNLTSLVVTDWWTTVSEVKAQGFLIPVGTNAGIQVGDKFKVMDVTYDWAGDKTPCKNELIMPFMNSTTPKALAHAQTVYVDYTYVVIDSSTAPLAQYDYVTIASLVQPAAAPCTNFLGIGCPAAANARGTLSRSIRIGTISSKPLPFTGKDGVVQVVDISPFVLDQLQTLLPAQALGGFYVHQ